MRQAAVTTHEASDALEQRARALKRAHGGRYLPIPRESDMWVFGYGSLMWNPEFPYLESRQALLFGWHRTFCVYSHRYRGTPDRPGLVLGLDAGGSCRGMAFRVARDAVDRTLDRLWEREMVTGVYRPTLLPLRLGTGRDGPDGRVRAVGFVVDRTHPQYAGGLDPERATDMICSGHGLRGPNADYLFNTVDHLDILGIADTPLHCMARRVADRLGR